MSDLITINQEGVFHLSNGRISYIFQVSPEGLLEHIHFGAAVTLTEDLSAGPRREFRDCTTNYRGIQHYSLEDTPLELPLFGTTDTRTPALHFINQDGNTVNDFVYQGHRIVAQKPPLKDLPSARGGQSDTLIISLKDEISQIEVTLFYTVYQDHDVVARSLEIQNYGDDSIQLLTALSSSIDLPSGDYDLIHLSGTWSREFNTQRNTVAQGRFVIESARGTSSNVHNPFVAIVDKQTNEFHGEVCALAMMYSGNFRINVEKSEFETVRVSAGINPFNFAWQLAPNESFVCPEALHVFSADGLNGMSQVWHRFIKQQISPPEFARKPRPVYLNSWESAYFDVSEESVLALADQAKSLGVEMLVLDDGWFMGRNDDSTSLGDWYADDSKFPNGIESLAREVSNKGLKFGLWFEPEMINQDSQLYRDHPEWVLGVTNRTRSTGRGQYILDLTQGEVEQYIFERLDHFLSCGDIHYVKWDMNRVMTEVGSQQLPPERQLEIPHRYMLALYRIVKRLTVKYSTVLFENCASGGNRFDLGMLNFMAQGWVSDMSEPIGRLPIINGASLLFPPSVLASYIGPVPSHQNGRLVSLKTRAEVGFFCAARGLSLSSTDLQSHHAELQAIVQLYKETATDLVNARFYRLKDSGNEVCWQLVTDDGERVYLIYVHILSIPNAPFRRAKLVGLNPLAQYTLRGNAQSFAGNSLMHLGIDLPYLSAVHKSSDPAHHNHMDKGDFASSLLIFNRVS